MISIKYTTLPVSHWNLIKLDGSLSKSNVNALLVNMHCINLIIEDIGFKIPHVTTPSDWIQLDWIEISIGLTEIVVA